MDYRQAEESGPQFCLPVIEKLRLCFQQCKEEISMPILILATVFKVLENAIALVLGVFLQMSVYGYVPPLSNFLRQIRSIEDKFWLEKCIFSSLG